MNLSLSLYRAYAEGYLSEVGDVLTGEELRSLPVGGEDDDAGNGSALFDGLSRRRRLF